jgi:hypothetical protein
MNRKTFDTLEDRTSEQTFSRLQPFNLIVLCDEKSAAAASETVILRLLARCLPLLDIHKDEWSFSELAHTEFAREAIELAASCDMLVVATRDDQNLAAAITSWLDCWVKTRAKVETALVWFANSRRGAREMSPVHAYLEELANLHELCFFASSATVKTPCMNEAVTTSTRCGLFSLYTPRPEGWGINE